MTDIVDRLNRPRDRQSAAGTDLVAERVRAAVAAERDWWRAELAYAEAALADIGDAEREPGDDLAWCEKRAAKALPRVRAALGA